MIKEFLEKICKEVFLSNRKGMTKMPLMKYTYAVMPTARTASSSRFVGNVQIFSYQTSHIDFYFSTTNAAWCGGCNTWLPLCRTQVWFPTLTYLLFYHFLSVCITSLRAPSKSCIYLFNKLSILHVWVITTSNSWTKIKEPINQYQTYHYGNDNVCVSLPFWRHFLHAQ